MTDILGTPKHTLLMTNNEEDAYPIGRKVRASIKGDTVQYRSYIKTNRNSVINISLIKPKGKTIKSRCSKELPSCREKCNSKIDDTLREQLFTTYWSIKNHDRRTSYISGLITLHEKKVIRKRRLTPEKQKNRNTTIHYFIPNKNKHLVKVCKGCFLKIFGETTKFLRNICNKKFNSLANNMTPDKSGHTQPKNKRTPEDIQEGIDHIKKLPAYESHYCQKQTTKKYLPPYFTLQAVYNEYIKTVPNPVCRSLYEKHFKLSGLKVKNSKKDTCAQCDRIKMQLSHSGCTSEKRIKLNVEKKATKMTLNKHILQKELTRLRLLTINVFYPLTSSSIFQLHSWSLQLHFTSASYGHII